uniref:3'-5' exonuclease domain-containing protein n=1 Tax=Ascaris lumbricoides TaxID=6252 RepID=A0A0M3IRG5_ASCLU
MQFCCGEREMQTASMITCYQERMLEKLLAQFKECGVQDGVLFCVDRSICSKVRTAKYCDRPCESITSSELRNVNYFADERIRTIPGKVSANDHFFNYFDIEMTGLHPGMCGAYAVQKLPRFLVINRKSVFEQIVTKLHAELDRTLYAHSQCDHRCLFGCEEVGYNSDIIKALKRSSIRFGISLHECKPIPAWLTYLAVLSVYALFILIGLLIYKFGIPEEGDALRIIKDEYDARRSGKFISDYSSV